MIKPIKFSQDIVNDMLRRTAREAASVDDAVRDIINIASRRNPYVQLILYPSQVQGEGAAQSIVRGIQALEPGRPPRQRRRGPATLPRIYQQPQSLNY